MNPELYNALQPVMTYIGDVGLNTIVASLIAGGVQTAFDRGSNLWDALANRRTYAAGFAFGVIGRMNGIDVVPECLEGTLTMDTVKEYLGAGMVGSVIGAVLNPAINSLRHGQTLLTDLPRRVRTGMIRGALAVPAGYAVLDALSR